MVFGVQLMSFKIVIYQGEEYYVLKQYTSGYCEIQKDRTMYHQIKLVHISELSEVIDKKKEGTH